MLYFITKSDKANFENFQRIYYIITLIASSFTLQFAAYLFVWFVCVLVCLAFTPISTPFFLAFPFGHISEVAQPNRAIVVFIYGMVFTRRWPLTQF